MSNWYEELPPGPLGERDFVKLGFILRLSDSYDSLSPRAVEVAQQRVGFSQAALRHATQKIVAEFTAGSAQNMGENHD